MENIQSYNWNNPFTFVIVVLVGLLILKKISMFLLVMLTVILGYGAQDLMITNINSESELISLPLIVYGVGGVSFIVLSLVSFYRSK